MAPPVPSYRPFVCISCSIEAFQGVSDHLDTFLPKICYQKTAELFSTSWSFRCFAVMEISKKGVKEWTKIIVSFFGGWTSLLIYWQFLIWLNSFSYQPSVHSCPSSCSSCAGPKACNFPQRCILCVFHQRKIKLYADIRSININRMGNIIFNFCQADDTSLLYITTCDIFALDVI